MEGEQEEEPRDLNDLQNADWVGGPALHPPIPLRMGRSDISQMCCCVIPVEFFRMCLLSFRLYIDTF